MDSLWTRARLTVLGDSTGLVQGELSVLESGKVAKGELLEELGSLPVRLHREGLVVVKLDTGKGGGSENSSNTRVACGSVVVFDTARPISPSTFSPSVPTFLMPRLLWKVHW